MRSGFYSIWSAVCVLLANGCATTGQVAFTSDPIGAVVEIETKRPGVRYSTTTPGEVALPKGALYLASFSLEGHHTVTVPLARVGVKEAKSGAAATAGAAGTTVLVYGAAFSGFSAAWEAAAFVGGVSPLALGFFVLAPVGLGIHAARGGPPLPEEVRVQMVREDAPAPENAGGIAHWRSKAEEERAARRAARAERDVGAGPRGKGM